jgi:aconitate hydratase
MAPGSSQVVTDYLTESGCCRSRSSNFQVVGYGCTTCIGNSGPSPRACTRPSRRTASSSRAVLSGNRNFEARIHPLVRANYLASPMLVVAYALAGRVDIDLYNEPLGHGKDGKPVFLADIWPTQKEIRDTVASALKPEMFTKRYGEVFEGDEHWRALPLPEEGSLYEWDGRLDLRAASPVLRGDGPRRPEPTDVHGARVLALLGQSVTTDHISPAGAIPKGSPRAST